MLKLLRKVICAAAELITMLRESSVFSLIPSWSFTNASLGAVSDTVFSVTQVGGFPVTSAAPHPGEHVRLLWRPEHTFVVTPDPTTPNGDAGEEEQ